MGILFNLASRIDTTLTWINLSPVSISLWFKINTLNAVTNRLVGSDDDWEIRITNDWTGNYRVSNELFASTVTSPPAYSTTIVTTGVWYHAVGTSTQYGASVIYINGVAEGTIPNNNDTVSGTTLGIGCRYGSALSQGTNGILEDVRVYNRILSASEVATIYACKGMDNIYYGLQNRWLLNEGYLGEVVTAPKDMVGLNHCMPTDSPTYDESPLTFINKWAG